jgi:hypothetical protein
MRRPFLLVLRALLWLAIGAGIAAQVLFDVSIAKEGSAIWKELALTRARETVDVKRADGRRDIFDDVAEAEVSAPAAPEGGFIRGTIYRDGKGLHWLYLGGNALRRDAWRVTNVAGKTVMPYPPFAEVGRTTWTDSLGVSWCFSGELDASGIPEVQIYGRSLSGN